MDLLSRRTLLVSSAALQRSTAANSAVTVGVIGVGNRGTLLAKLAASSARLVALCDTDTKNAAAAQARHPQAKMYKDHEALLASGVDAVIIATPVFLHKQHLEAAVAAGKHIYLEKPAAASVAECKQILKIADSAPRKFNLNLGFQRRYAALYQEAYKQYAAGAVGKFHWAKVEFVKASDDPAVEPGPSSEEKRRRHWYRWKDLSGDLIVENNVHVIDVMNWFAGEHPVSAHGTGGRTRVGYGDTRDHNHVTFSYSKGVQGVLVGTILAGPGYREVREQFHGPSGMVETSEKGWRLIRNGKTEVAKVPQRGITEDSIAAFIDRIATGKPENTGVRGVESTLTAILGRMAMDKGREVTWDEMLREG